MASYRQKTNGKYEGTIYIGRDMNGKKITKTVTADKLKDCKAKVREIEQEIAEGKLTKSTIGNMRFSAWCDKWLELNKRRLSPSTYATYKMYSNYHFKEFFGNVKLNQITDIMIKEFIGKQLEKDLSSTTVRKHVMNLRRILEEALKNRNPARDIELPKEEAFAPYVPTKEEYEKIYNSYRTKKHKIIIQLAGLCGLRRGEIYALRWDDILWNDKAIRVDESKCITDKGDYVYKSPKSKRGFRNVPCSDAILDAIKEYRKCYNLSGDFVFEGRPDKFTSNFSEKMKSLGLPVRFHDLRHYCASWMYEEGIQDHIVAEILGHDVTVLKKIYQHIGVEKKKTIMDNIRNIQEEKRPTT